MKWLVDECTGPAIGRWLREQAYDVYSVGEQSPGWSDWQVLAHAVNEDRVSLPTIKTLVSSSLKIIYHIAALY